MQTDKPKPPRKPPAAKRFPPKRPPKRLIKIGNAMLAPALAIVVVLATAAAGSGAADYALIIQGVNDGGLVDRTEVVCAKSHSDCETARRAILEKLWVPIGLDKSNTVRCEPHPGCFPESSNHIRGFN